MPETFSMFGIAAAQLGVILLAAMLLLWPACWTYNKVNGLAPPGLGRSDSRDYTLVSSPDMRFYSPPRALSRYDSATTAAGGVPLPGLLRSQGIALAFALTFGVVFVLLLVVFGAATSATGSTPAMSLLLTDLAAIPLGLLLLAGLVTLLLPTTFSRAMLVALVFFLMFLTLAALLCIAAFLVSLAAGYPLPTY